MRILLVEDEKVLSYTIADSLKDEYEVDQVFDGLEAEYAAKQDIYDVIILDLMLPEKDGYQVLESIRKDGILTPVLILTAKDTLNDKLKGFQSGADDYLTKPYSPKELVLRVNNMIKRVYKNTKSKQINYEDYLIDIDKRIVTEHDKEIKLTNLEFDLLLLFINNKSKSFSRDEILNNVWGNDYFGSDRVVDDLVRRLRKKMPKLNLTAIYGYGYRLQ